MKKETGGTERTVVNIDWIGHRLLCGAKFSGCYRPGADCVKRPGNGSFESQAVLGHGWAELPLVGVAAVQGIQIGRPPLVSSGEPSYSIGKHGMIY